MLKNVKLSWLTLLLGVIISSNVLSQTVWIITDDHKQFNVPVVVAQESPVFASYIAENIFEIWLTQANNLPISSFTFSTILEYLNKLYIWHHEQQPHSDETINAIFQRLAYDIIESVFNQTHNYLYIISFIKACDLLKLPHRLLLIPLIRECYRLRLPQRAEIEFDILNQMVHILNLELVSPDQEYTTFNQLFGVDDDIYYRVHEFRNREVALPLYEKGLTLSMLKPQPDYLNLSNLHLTSITGLRYIPHINIIRFLNLSNNQITQISDGSLNNLNNVREINLSNNSLVTIRDKNAFQGKPYLRTILLNNNKVRFLFNNIFANLENLAEVNLNNNQLEGLPKDLFASTPNLRHLHLAYNNIEDLEPNIFNPLSHLIFLDVRGNKLPYDEVTFREKYLSRLPNVVLLYSPQRNAQVSY